MTAVVVGLWLAGAFGAFELQLVRTAGWPLAKRTLVAAAIGAPIFLAAAVAIHGIVVMGAGVALLFTLILLVTRGHPDYFMDASYRFALNTASEDLMRQHDKRARRIQLTVILAFLIITLPIFLLKSN